MPRPPISTLFPYTTLFRSVRTCDAGAVAALVDVCCRGNIHRSEEHTSELQSQSNLVCRLLLEKKKAHINIIKLGRAHVTLTNFICDAASPQLASEDRTVEL